MGLKESIISNGEIISYAVSILSENMDQFDIVLELAIAEEDEAEEIVFNLALEEGEQDLKLINSKWIFAIIYDAYINSKDTIYDVIDDVYTEFEYPNEISNLIGYMTSDDGRTIDEKLNQYIEINREIWC